MGRFYFDRYALPMALMLLIAFVASVLLPILYKLLGRFTAYFAALIPAGIFIYLFQFIGQDSPEIVSYSWVPSLGLSFSFYLDGLALFFALLITGFGTLVFLYAAGYMRSYGQQGRFYAFLMLFMSAMLGLVVSDNLLCMFVFWELTSLSSYLLISFFHEKESARASALQALLVTAVGGLSLLAGAVLIGMAAGTYSLTEIMINPEVLRESPYYIAIVLLVFGAAFTKSAQFPFHFWLPNAMAAPTPVSAYLHSATMVKAGIFLLMRLSVVLGATPIWQITLTAVGAFTMLIGAVMAMFQDDIKAVLAYITISALGILVMMTGVGTPAAIESAMVFLLAHALYKASLFMVAGNIDKQTGTRVLNRLGGLWKVMPITGIAALLGCLSLAGAPPLLGFIGKEMLFQSAIDATAYNIALLISTMIAGAIFVALSIEMVYGVFFGKPKVNVLEKTREAVWSMSGMPLILGSVGLIAGIFGATFILPVLQPAASTILAAEINLDLSLWHGFNTVLLLSVVTILSGVILFKGRNKVRMMPLPRRLLYFSDPETGYNAFVKGLTKVAFRQTAILQNGLLRNYNATIIGFFVFLMVLAIFKSFPETTPIDWGKLSSVHLIELVTLIAIVLSVVYFFMTNSRLNVLVALGLAGFSIAVLFILYSAPDVAMTQFLVETLTLLLFILILHKLPVYEGSGDRKKSGNIVYAIIAVAFGAVMTAIAYVATDDAMDTTVKSYYLKYSDALGKGENVVNVILVDFRAMDTMGEITVLAITAIGIIALLGKRKNKGGNE